MEKMATDEQRKIQNNRLRKEERGEDGPIGEGYKRKKQEYRLRKDEEGEERMGGRVKDG